MYAKRIVVTALVAALTLLGAAMPAAADHDHVRLLPNGKCVILAEHGNEKYVELPGTEDDFDEGRRHPLHVNVHLGEPGTQDGEDVIFVLGSDEAEEACDGYVNP